MKQRKARKICSACLKSGLTERGDYPITHHGETLCGKLTRSKLLWEAKRYAQRHPSQISSLAERMPYLKSGGAGY